MKTSLLSARFLSEQIGIRSFMRQPRVVAIVSDAEPGPLAQDERRRVLAGPRATAAWAE